MAGLNLPFIRLHINGEIGQCTAQTYVAQPRFALDPGGPFPLEAVAKAGLAATNVHPFENRIEMAGQL